MTAASREVRIQNQRGLHARASAKFVQMVERFLRQCVATVNAVHELQRSNACPLNGTLLQPPHELLGLGLEAESHKRIQRERRGRER